ncbi:hypothetical protein [uncultured Jannaschia sp.]|nr:hypothetical protein [uncultured Jannaschia sp.]
MANIDRIPTTIRSFVPALRPTGTDIRPGFTSRRPAGMLSLRQEP